MSAGTVIVLAANYLMMQGILYLHIKYLEGCKSFSQTTVCNFSKFSVIHMQKYNHDCFSKNTRNFWKKSFIGFSSEVTLHPLTFVFIIAKRYY